MDNDNQEVVNTEVSNIIQSPLEDEARAQGWKPKEEFDGEDGKWIPADEYVRRGSLFKKIDIQNQEIKEVKKALAQLAQHHAKVREVEYQRALESLKTQKRDAFTEGDPDKIIEIDEKIDTIKEAQKAFNAEQKQKLNQEVQEVHPEMQAWVNKNSWYNKSAPMKAFADALGVELAQKGMSPAEVLKEVEKQVKAEFPKRFVNENRSKPSSVEGGGKESGKSGVGFSPTAFEKQIAERFVRQGVFKSTEDYYKELKLMNKGQA